MVDGAHYVEDFSPHIERARPDSMCEQDYLPSSEDMWVLAISGWVSNSYTLLHGPWLLPICHLTLFCRQSCSVRRSILALSVHPHLPLSPRRMSQPLPQPIAGLPHNGDPSALGIVSKLIFGSHSSRVYSIVRQRPQELLVDGYSGHQGPVWGYVYGRATRVPPIIPILKLEDVLRDAL